MNKAKLILIILLLMLGTIYIGIFIFQKSENSSLKSFVPKIAPNIPNSLNKNGWFHVVGNQILDNQNQAIIFHGVNSSGMEWGAGYQWTNGKCKEKIYGCWSIPSQDEYNNLSAWGFNLVRLPISWANLEPMKPQGSPNDPNFHKYNQEYLTTLDEIINEFSKRGIHVIISMHQWAWSPVITVETGQNAQHGLGMPVWFYTNTPNITQTQAQLQFFANKTKIAPSYTAQDGFIDVWKMLANRYKDNSTVIGFDLFNEPPNNINFNLKAFYEKVGSQINIINPNILFIAEDAVNQGFKLNNKLDLPNVIYSFHMYPRSWMEPGKTQPSGKEEIENHLQVAKAWDVPIFVGEFAYIGASGEIDAEQTKTMLSFFKKNSVNWTYWAYQKANKALTGVSGTEPSDMKLIQILQNGF